MVDYSKDVGRPILPTLFMQAFKPHDEELAELQAAAQQLQTANTQIAAANKDAENAKATLAKWLKEKRSVDVNTLGIGALIVIEGAALIEVTRQIRFDEVSFSQADPTTYAKFRRDVLIRKFKPLV